MKKIILLLVIAVTFSQNIVAQKKDNSIFTVLKNAFTVTTNSQTNNLHNDFQDDYDYIIEYNQGYRDGVNLAKTCERSRLYSALNTPSTEAYKQGLSTGFETEYRRRGCNIGGGGCQTVWWRNCLS